MAYTVSAAFGAKTKIDDLKELDTYLGSNAKFGKKYHALIDDALNGDITGKSAQKIIDHAKLMAEYKRGRLEGIVSSSESTRGWFGRIKSVFSSEMYSTGKLDRMYDRLQELKQQQAAGFPGMDDRITKLTKQFEEEARRVLPNLPLAKQSAEKAAGVINMQIKQATVAASKGVDMWGKEERAAKIKEISAKLVTDEVAIKTGDTGALVKSKDGKYHKWDSTNSKHVANTDAADRAAKTQFNRTEVKDFQRLMNQKKLDIGRKIRDEYKLERKKYNKIVAASEKAITGIEEETGLKAGDVMSQKGKEALAKGGNAEAIKALEKTKTVTGRIGHNLTTPGFMGRAKVAAGTIGFFDGLRRVWNGCAPGEDENGKPKAVDPVQIGMGVGEAIIGVAAAQHVHHP